MFLALCFFPIALYLMFKILYFTIIVLSLDCKDNINSEDNKNLKKDESVKIEGGYENEL